MVLLCVSTDTDAMQRHERVADGSDEAPHCPHQLYTIVYSNFTNDCKFDLGVDKGWETVKGAGGGQPTVSKY